MTKPKQLSPSPLTLEHHQFLEVHLTTAEEDEPDGGISLGTGRRMAPDNDDPRRFRLELSVDVGSGDSEDPAPYEARLVIEGIFQVAEAYPKDKVTDLVMITGASILYGACREMLVNLTARGRHGIVSLPSISFVQPNEAAKKKTANSKKKKAATKAAKK